MARPDHGARAARRRRLPQPLPRDPLRVGGRLRAPVPRPGVRRRLLECGDRARRRRRAAAPVRRRGAARRPAGVHHDPEPLVPDRGAHPAAARPLAAEGGLRSCLRPRPARAGRARTTCSGAATSAASFPARCASSTSASRSSRSHERAPAPDRARRPDRRARGAQPGDGGAVGCRHPRCGARRRRRLEGRAARRRPRGGAPRRAVGAAPALGRPACARLRRVRAALLAPAAELARRRRDPPRSALRRAPRPDPGRRLLPRPPARPHAAVLAPALARARRGRGRAHGLGADRRLPGAAAVVARLRRARLVRRPARARLQGHLGAARRTGSSTPATRTTRSAGSSRASSARSPPPTSS